MPDTFESEFERLVREYLTQRPLLRHEWRTVPSRWWGDRLDLVFQPSAPSQPEVFATILDGQIVVGAGEEDEDFEDFGRGLSDVEIAQRAFAKLLQLLSENGCLGQAGGDG